MSTNTIKQQGDGKYSVRIGNQKFNGLSKSEAQSRSNSNFQVAPDSETDSPAQKRRNSAMGVNVGDTNVVRDNAFRNPIDAESLASVTPVSLPKPPVSQNYNGVIAGANASLVNPASGTTTDPKGNLVVTPPKPEGAGGAEDYLSGLFQQYMGAKSDLNDSAPSSEKTYNDLYKQSGLKEIDKAVNRYSSQINNIVAKSQADQLAVTGQGRGIPEVIIGGQQAQISKEAAIQALPLQALLANAQGQKEVAQQHLDTLFKIKMDDARTQYEYKSKVLDTVYQFATETEKRRLDVIQRKEDQAFQRETLKIQQDHQLRMEQIGYNNSVKLKQMDIAASSAAGNEYGTLSGKPQNVSQASANGYADRLIGANSAINNLGKNFTGKTAIGGILPNWLQSGDRQAYEQAKKNFATAVLRRESGASIAPSEFDTLNTTYFPQAGDQPDVIAQKAALRNTVINSFYREANIPRPLSAGDIVEQDGITYKVSSDGFTLEKI